MSTVEVGWTKLRQSLAGDSIAITVEVMRIFWALALKERLGVFVHREICAIAIIGLAWACEDCALRFSCGACRDRHIADLP